MISDDSGQDDSYSGEIIALLQQVGQRLLRSEKERKELRAIMNDLEEKTEQSERAFLTVQDRLHKTESAIAKRQKRLEKIQLEQAQRVEKAAQMADKIEEAIAQNARINRRLDKMAQDKARTIRKLDRIEEAVTETQEAMRSNAMVLLSEQNSKNNILHAKGSNDIGIDDDVPWWQTHIAVRAGAVSAMILLGVFGGWILNQIDTGQISIGAKNSSYQTASYDSGNDLTEPPSFDTLATYQEPETTSRPSQAAQEFSAQIERALSDQNAENTLVSENEAPASNQTQESAAIEKKEPQESKEEVATQKAPEPKDPMDLDDERLIANLNENPGALAAQLNEITPSAGAGSNEKVQDIQKPVPAAKPKPQEIDELSAEEFLASQNKSGAISSRISPDDSLPEVIKEVEKKAFEGMPEAQHDLAAIYTAGHGGVEVNFERAALWFRESALQGIANARYNLGVLYHQGLGVKEDINTAVNWYKAAAEAGHPEAQYNLAIAYIEGIGTNYNPDKAAQYFEEAATQGILEAAYNLGLIHENGLTGKTKPDSAIFWYKKAADMGSPEAQMALDQLVKSLGMSAEEVDYLYNSKSKSEKKASVQNEDTKTARSNNVKQPQKDIGDGYEYIEAQPLDSAPQSSAPTPERAQAPISPPAPAKKAEAVDAVKSEKEFNVTHAVIAQIQEQLIRIGLYPGPADGVNDTLTGDAIRAYQAHYELKQDGRPSEALLVHMMTSDLGSSTEYGSRAE